MQSRAAGDKVPQHWIPELFSAAALDRLRMNTTQKPDATVPYFYGLHSGDTHARIGSYPATPSFTFWRPSSRCSRVW